MMTRASFYLPEPLLQRIHLISKRKKQSASDYVRSVLARALAHEEQAELDKQYAAWERVKGMVKEPISDASTTIDAVLYGENSVWDENEEEHATT